MKLFSASAVCLALVCCASAAGVKQEIDAANKQICDAMKKKDMALLEKVMKANITSDFTYEEAGQKMDFKTMFTTMKAGIAQMKTLTKVEAKVISVKESGKTATAKVNHLQEGTMMMPDKKSHKMVFKGISTNVLRQEGGKWKMSKMSWDKTEMLMDGKPMDMSKMGGGR